MPSSSERAAPGRRPPSCSRERARECVLVDKGAYGSDALSTHALMRGAVLQLHRWGLLARHRCSRHAAGALDHVQLPRAGRHRADRAEIWRQRVVRATPGAARPDPGRRRGRQRSRRQVRCPCRRRDPRRSRARAWDHCCRRWHTSPHRCRHRHRRRRTAFDDRAARGRGPRCRGPALDGSSLQLLGRLTG